jgi:hypothetical protein
VGLDCVADQFIEIGDAERTAAPTTTAPIKPNLRISNTPSEV